jgi:hypothetical protein
MDNNFLIFDNFYNNVDQVREEALKQEFDVSGNYPGLRTSPEPAKQSEYLKTFFENLISKKIVTGLRSIILLISILQRMHLLGFITIKQNMQQYST